MSRQKSPYVIMGRKWLHYWKRVLISGRKVRLMGNTMRPFMVLLLLASRKIFRRPLFSPRRISKRRRNVSPRTPLICYHLLKVNRIRSERYRMQRKVFSLHHVLVIRETRQVILLMPRKQRSMALNNRPFRQFTEILITLHVMKVPFAL